MKMQNGRVILEDAASFSPTSIGVDYTDINGNKVHIPIKLLVRLYEGSKFHHERTSDFEWCEFCNGLFE